MNRYIMLTAMLFVLFCTAPTRADVAPYPDEILQIITELKANKDVPSAIPGVMLVNTAEAKQFWESGKATFLDNRPKSQYDAEKIKDAKWFFSDDLLKNPDMAKKLDKSKRYILYCNGDRCWRSAGAALMLKSLGFENIYWYRAGIPEWKKEGLPTEKN